MLYTYVKKYGLHTYVLEIFFGIFSTLPQSPCMELLPSLCTSQHLRSIWKIPETTSFSLIKKILVHEKLEGGLVWVLPVTLTNGHSVGNKI